MNRWLNSIWIIALCLPFAEFNQDGETWNRPQSVAARGQAKAHPAQPGLREFTFDAEASQINIILTQEGMIRRRYPTHLVVARSFNGKIALPKDEARMAVEMEAEAKMMTNADELMSEFERKEFHNVLRNEMLEADKFPTIRFVSVSVSNVKKSGNKRSFTLNGDLILHGVTKRMTVPVNATISEKELRADGEAKLKQSDFGLKPFEKGLGLIKIGDVVKVSFSIVAKSQ